MFVLRALLDVSQSQVMANAICVLISSTITSEGGEGKKIQNGAASFASLEYVCGALERHKLAHLPKEMGATVARAVGANSPNGNEERKSSI
ncbi:hypothetical protein Pfo_006560 [Paulownia fortunei]|nr:hypothetical protein Pfo_006560 [Paulownia fortunei]